MYISNKEIEALLLAKDFIAANSTGADDSTVDLVDVMYSGINSILKKSTKERERIIFKRSFKKAMEKHERKQSEACTHDKEPIEDAEGFLVCPDCGKYGADC